MSPSKSARKVLLLVSLTPDYREQLFEMMEEWCSYEGGGKDDRTPFAIFKNDYHDFDLYLDRLEIKEERDGLVPDSTFFALDEDGVFVGAVNIRHRLNEKLLRTGGHIGDGIRPSRRGQGYGKEMLRLALEECRKLGIDRVLMTCGKENVASARTILGNGGVLENEIALDDGEILQRYWIDL